MYLRSFDRNGNAEISISVDEINILCNALHNYVENHKGNYNIEKGISELRRKFYIFYEVIHHGCCFDDATMRILEKMKSCITLEEGEDD